MLTVAFNQFINPVAIDAIGWWYYLVYCAWLIVELVFVAIFVVETKGRAQHFCFFLAFLTFDLGRTLEETSALFDGDEQPNDLTAMGGEAATISMSCRNIVDLDQKYSQEERVELHELHSRQYSDLTSRAIWDLKFVKTMYFYQDSFVTEVCTL